MQHLAIVMDGNRRWAKQQGLRVVLGHRQGAQSVQRVLAFCLKKGIPYVSLYTFSLENFRRNKEEVEYLFNLLVTEAHNNLDAFIEKGIRVRFIGERSLFPETVIETITHVEQSTAHLTALNVNFLFCYGARQEIVAGIKTLFKKVKDGSIAIDDISDTMFSDYLWTAGMPEPDLIIRTGGVKRLSNFLLYQAAYSEFYFLDCLWPEINETHLQSAMANFEECKRNFGT